MGSIKSIWAVAGLAAGLAVAAPAAADWRWSDVYAGAALGQVAIASYPFNDPVSIYGKAGVYDGKLEQPGADERRSRATCGAAVRYGFTPDVAVRAEWQRYEKMGGGPVIESDADVLSVGVLYTFK